MRTPSYFDGEVSFGAVTKAERLVAERLSRRRRDTFVVVPGVRQRAQQAQAATVLQQWWRDLLQQRVVSVVKVQAWWRGIRQRRQYTEQLAAVKTVQQAIREWHGRRDSQVRIARWWRARLWRGQVELRGPKAFAFVCAAFNVVKPSPQDNERSVFVKLRWSAIILQRQYRAVQGRRRAALAAASTPVTKQTAEALAIEEKRRALTEIKLKRMLLQSQLLDGGSVTQPAVVVPAHELARHQAVARVADHSRRVLALSEVDLEQVTQMNTHQNAGYLRVFRIEEVMLGKQPPPGRYPYRYSAEIEHAENREYDAKPEGVRGVRWSETLRYPDEEEDKDEDDELLKATTVRRKSCVSLPKLGVLDSVPIKLSPMKIVKVSYAPPPAAAILQNFVPAAPKGTPAKPPAVSQRPSASSVAAAKPSVPSRRDSLVPKLMNPPAAAASAAVGLPRVASLVAKPPTAPAVKSSSKVPLRSAVPTRVPTSSFSSSSSSSTSLATTTTKQPIRPFRS